MANALYPQGKAGIMRGDIDLLADTIKFVIVDLADYTYSSTHEYLADIPSGARVAITSALSSKVIEDTAAFKSDNAIAATVTGDEIEAIVMFKDTGDAATSRLILFQDTGLTGAPLTPDGSDVRISMNANGWFTL
jgi:hypothetical protein